MHHPTTVTTDSVTGTVRRVAIGHLPKKPLRYWQVDHFFKCPLAGMCLSPAEQKQVAKKAGLSDKRSTPFEIHEALVASSESENRLSRRVDALLQRKYGKTSGHLHHLDDRAFLERFRQDFASGDYLGSVWAAATHPALSATVRRSVFGDVHMSMHWSADQRSLVLQRLQRKEAELAAMADGARDAARQNRALQSEKAALQRDLERRTAELAAARNVPPPRAAPPVAKACGLDDALAAKNRQLKQKLAAMGESLVRQKEAVASLTQEKQSLQEALSQQKALNAHFRAETREVMASLSGMHRCDADCPAFDLCRKRVLIVGGITRMASLYKEMIEGSGGVFEYHDGYMKNGVRQLESRLKRADVVLCPVSCNSHAACSIVKNLAKKHNKTVHMLANSSLSAVSQVIRGGESQKAAIH
ncbi:DUF2325 domain-containing protein [Desulfatitalea alkaliphila]|uniref:DUF2325 domain-containing protein n=1 Tax=Desulfatitalea alkaliphila TaxID=2929485 RepID=A0AA41UI76_9BACT|nr:DUF2325 domain-containing protein [Desulfatitalea alkaliphila]MCJ8499769.1 DUF2325 domain-containing protein [Desulfatitalea alkaliphila]